MESELYEVAVEGNVQSLLTLLSKDRLLLDRVMVGNKTESPLHIAAMLGHSGFVEEVIARKPELAKEQNSQGLTPLHLAAAKGYFHIVKNLLEVDPEVCFVRDKYRRNPLHVAAMKGHVDILELLVRVRPSAACDILENGQTIMHLCVKNNRLEALKLLTDILDDEQFINSKDEDGNTILHLAAADRQTETILFLSKKGINSEIMNYKGLSALVLSTQFESVESKIVDNMVTALNPPGGIENEMEKKRKWINSTHKMLIIVAILLAGMAAQACINLPSRIWVGGKNHAAHTGGDLSMAKTLLNLDKLFVQCIVISLATSFSIILLLASFSLKEEILTRITILTTWVAVIFMGSALAMQILVLIQDNEENITYETVTYETVTTALEVWAVLMTLIFMCNFFVPILEWLPGVLNSVFKVLKFLYRALKKQKREHVTV